MVHMLPVWRGVVDMSPAWRGRSRHIICVKRSPVWRKCGRIITCMEGLRQMWGYCVNFSTCFVRLW